MSEQYADGKLFDEEECCSYYWAGEIARILSSDLTAKDMMRIYDVFMNVDPDRFMAMIRSASDAASNGRA